MAKRRARPTPPPTPPEPDPHQLSMDAPTTGQALGLFPHELRPGDVYRDSGGVEWTARTVPRTYLNGHRVEAKVSPAGAPTAAINMVWPAHQKLEVWRAEAR